jgi:hypothetical protein
MPEEGSRRNRKTGSCCGATKTPRHQEGWKAHRLERRKVKPSLLPRLAMESLRLTGFQGRGMLWEDSRDPMACPLSVAILSESPFLSAKVLSAALRTSLESKKAPVNPGDQGGLTRPSGFPGEFVLFDSWYDSAMPTRFLFALPGKTRGSCPRSSHITRPSSSSYIRR